MPESGPDPEAVFQQLAQPKNGKEGRGGPVVKVKILPKLEPIYMLGSRGRATRVLKEDKLKPCRLLLFGVFDYKSPLTKLLQLSQTKCLLVKAYVYVVKRYEMNFLPLAY